MASALCIETFEAAPEDETRAKIVDATHPECACETERVSRHCADPVLTAETLARIVLDPTHIERDEGGLRLKTSFFSDAASFGSSCLRLERASPDEYVCTIKEMLEKNPIAASGHRKFVVGVLIFPVKQVRDEISETKDPKGTVIDTFTAFAVYATGLSDRPNHADIMVNRVSTISKSQANRVGINLTKKINLEIQAGKSFCDIDGFKHVVDLTEWSQSGAKQI